MKQFPSEFISSLESVLGKDGAARAVEAMAGESSVSVRLNPFKRLQGSTLPILEGSSPVPWSPYGHILVTRPVFTLHPLFHAGVYYVQDSSAMFVGWVFRRLLERFPERPLRVLDLCAAPGGKTTDLAASLREACGDDFLLVSNEVMRQRASVLSDNVAVWGDPRVAVTSVDPKAFASLPGFFDIILADVPCSGEGMFRKDEKAVEDWSPETVELCASRQKRILADVWPSLREGGALLYSTCTFEDAENDSNLEWAAQELGGAILPPEEAFGLRTTRHGHLLVPGEVPGEGQWVGALIKDGSGRTCVITGSRLHLIEPLGFQLTDKKRKRAGLDYWDRLDVTRYADYTDFCTRNPGIQNGLPPRNPLHNSPHNPHHGFPSFSGTGHSRFRFQ